MLLRRQKDFSSGCPEHGRRARNDKGSLTSVASKGIRLQINARPGPQTLNRVYATAARTASMMRDSDGPMCASSGGLYGTGTSRVETRRIPVLSLSKPVSEI